MNSNRVLAISPSQLSILKTTYAYMPTLLYHRSDTSSPAVYNYIFTNYPKNVKLFEYFWH